MSPQKNNPQVNQVLFNNFQNQNMGKIAVFFMKNRGIFHEKREVIGRKAHKKIERGDQESMKHRKKNATECVMVL